MEERVMKKFVFYLEHILKWECTQKSHTMNENGSVFTFDSVRQISKF